MDECQARLDKRAHALMAEDRKIALKEDEEHIDLRAAYRMVFAEAPEMREEYNDLFPSLK